MPTKATKRSKFFRVATEGATTDGRKIEGRWIREIAETYDPAKYTARIFIEHIRGINPEFGFRCQGDVVAVESREVDGGKLALFAQIEPTEQLVQMVGEKQKIFSSIEVQENFANSGKAYLVGFGVTDSPASLGTDRLAFAAQHPEAKLFDHVKHAPGNVITAVEESEIQFEDVTPKPSLFTRVKSLLNKERATSDERFADVHGAVEEIAQQTVTQAEEIGTVKAAQGTFRTDFAALKADVAALSSKIDHTAAPEQQRPPATGGNGAVVTDC